VEVATKATELQNPLYIGMHGLGNSKFAKMKSYTILEYNLKKGVLEDTV